MNTDESKKTVTVIKDLARVYQKKQQEIERVYEKEKLNFRKIIEMEGRCDMLTDQFRILQQNLINQLEEEDLTNFIRTSEIFDEIRILCLLAFDTLKDKLSEDKKERTDFKTK